MRSSNYHWLKWPASGAVILGVAGLVAALGLRAHYEDRLRRQIWPELAPEITVVSNSAIGSMSSVMLLGDSRIAHWGLPKLAHWRVINAGKGGLSTGEVRLAAPRLLDQFHPKVVVLQAGINDLKFLGLQPEMSQQIVSLAASNLVATINECTLRHCRVIVLKTWPAGKPEWARWFIWNASIAASVDQLNARLAGLNSPAAGIEVIDLFQEAGLKTEPESYLDALHFKPAVYQKLTPALEKKLNEIPL